MARFDMDFRDVVIVQGTMGQIVSQNGDPLLVKWERIGDRPAAPSQLLPIVGPPQADEDVFFPTVKRKAEVPTIHQKMMVVEEVEEEPVLSPARLEELAAIEARMEENAATEGEKSQGKGKGKGQRKGMGKKG